MVFVAALIKYAKDDLHFYDNHLIAAAEFNQTDKGIVANALFSGKAVFGFPISMNLLSNAILRGLTGTDDYSIRLSSQGLPSLTNFRSNEIMVDIQTYTTAVIFAFLFSPVIALFVIHPLRESSTNVKQLQRMSGISCFTYWGTMFVFDLIVLLMLMMLVLIGFVSMDAIFKLQLYDSTAICEFRHTITGPVFGQLAAVFIKIFIPEMDMTWSQIVLEYFF